MTKVVVAKAYGGPEVLAIEQIELAPPGPGDVLVEVKAAGTNPVDFKLYSGQFGSDPARLPMRLGLEASGIVREVVGDAEGPGGRIRPGDEVIVSGASGAYASELVVPASAVFPKPSPFDFAAASGLMVVGTTAIHLLTVTRVAAGDTVLVHGAAGGVGSVTVQLAVGRGARVIGTASPARHTYLVSLGAEPVAYGAGLVERVRALAPDGVDVALDLVGTDEALDASVELVADRDRIATIAGFQRGGELGLHVLGNGPGADPGTVVRERARMELVRLAEAKAISILVAARFPLAEAATAHRELAAGHTSGKIVLEP